MVHRIFTIHDSKAEAFLPPFFLPTAGMATRAFADMVMQPEHAFNQHPEDYTLFEIGEWSDIRGTIETYEAKKGLGNGLEYSHAELDQQALKFHEVVK